MKKFTCIVLLCMSVLSLSAQEHARGQVRFGVKAGLNVANAFYESDGYSISTSAIPGLLVGVVGDLRLSEALYLNSGLLYSGKGFSWNYDGMEIDNHINYLEIPVNLAYKWYLRNINLFVQSGPYIGIGLNAKAKSGSNSVDIKFGSDDDQLKRIDAGLGIGTGIEVKNFQFGLNYDFGLVDLENDSRVEFYNMVFSFTVGYFF